MIDFIIAFWLICGSITLIFNIDQIGFSENPDDSVIEETGTVVMALAMMMVIMALWPKWLVMSIVNRYQAVVPKQRY